MPHTPPYDAYKLDGMTPLAAFTLPRSAGDSAWDRAERSHHPPADAAAGYGILDAAWPGAAQAAS